MSLISLFLLLQQCPACFVCLIWMILEIGDGRLYNCCFMGCCFQDLFNIACSILVQFPSSFFSRRFISIHVVHPYSRIDTTPAWKKLCFILLDRLDLHMIDNLPIAVHTFARRMLMSFLVDEILLLRYVNLSTNFREPPFRADMSPSWLKHVICLSAFTWKPVPPAPDYAAGIWLG